MEKVYLEYAKEAELIEKVEKGYKVRITAKDEVTEKIVGYEPLPIDGWKYEDGTLIIKDGKYAKIKRHTTYIRDGIMVFAYKKHDIHRFSDDLVYESEIVLADLATMPYLPDDKFQELADKEYNELKPLRNKQKEIENELETIKKQIEGVKKTFSLDEKCLHEWEENGEEDYNDGRSTKKSYICGKCSKENHQYWHKL